MATGRRTPVATRAQDDLERQRAEQGERFLKQMGDMFAQTRQDLAAQFIPRGEGEARFDHLEQVVERIGTAMEKLTSNVTNFHENVPRFYAERTETKQDIAELRTEIEKLKTARETDMQRGYGYRIEDMQGRYKGDFSTQQQVYRQATRIDDRTLQWLFLVLIAGLSVVLPILLRKP